MPLNKTTTTKTIIHININTTICIVIIITTSSSSINIVNTSVIVRRVYIDYGGRLSVTFKYYKYK